jgi:hypothetical protein
MTYPMYRVIREAWSDSANVALVQYTTDYLLGGTLHGARVDALFATANYWRVLGVEPQLGRFYAPDEDRVGAGTPVVVLSDHLWRTQFNADTAILGKTVQLNGTPSSGSHRRVSLATTIFGPLTRGCLSPRSRSRPG